MGAPIRRLSSARANTVVAYVAHRAGITAAQLRDGRKLRSRTDARHIAAWLLRRAGYSYPEIAMSLGWRDHTSAMHAVARIAAARETDAALAADLSASESALAGQQTGGS